MTCGPIQCACQSTMADGAGVFACAWSGIRSPSAAGSAAAAPNAPRNRLRVVMSALPSVSMPILQQPNRRLFQHAAEFRDLSELAQAALAQLPHDRDRRAG